MEQNPASLLKSLTFKFFLLGFAGTIILVFFAGRDAYRNQKDIFLSESQIVRDNVIQTLDHVHEVISSLTVFMAAHGGNTDPDSFRIFSEDIFTFNPHIVSTSYSTFVKHAHRKNFVEAKRKKGFVTFSISKWQGRAYSASPEQKYYFPLIYHEPFEPQTASLIGFDILSEKQYAGLVQTAITSASQQFVRIQPHQKNVGEYWLIKPTFAGKSIPSSPDIRRLMVNGIASLGLDITQMLTPVIPNDTLFSLRLSLISGDKVIDLYGEESINPDQFLTVFSKNYILKINEQEFEIEIRKFLTWSSFGWQLPLLAFLTGLLITGLLLLTARNISLRHIELQRRNKEIEDQVREKTLELTQTNKKLNQENDERKKVEFALRKSEEHLSRLVQQSPLAIISWDQDFKVTDWNRAAEKIFGYSLEEAIGQHAEFIVPPTVRELVDKIWQDLLHLEGGTWSQNENITKSGKSIQCEWYNTPLVNGAGNVIGVLSLVEDVSEHIHAEQALKQASMEWSAAMDAFEDIIYLVDINRNLVRANKTFYDKMGLSPENAVGRHIAEILHPKGENGPCPVCQAQEEKRDAVVTMEEDHPNNPAGVPIEITVKIIRDNAGNPFSIFVNIRDLTNARKEIEEKKRLEEQLRQAQKMESIGTLAGGIAHDFNNILAAIIGYTEIANIETPKDSPVKKDLSEVLKAAHRAKELVKQILTFSRKADYTVEPVLPVPIIKEALKMLRASIPTNIEIKQDIDSECGGTLADPTQIHQILVNLCTNAYQAMEEKGGVLTVTLAKKDLTSADTKETSDITPGPYMELTVTDTGSGMDKETRERIFEPYFTSKDQDKGTGLGLSVVHGIVKSLGGIITVDSAPGQGSSFNILLPRIEKSDSQSAAQSAPLPTGTEHILVVDDEEAIVAFEKQSLERLGYTVTSETDSQKALEIFRADPDKFDLVITDMTMPRLNGAELTKELLAIHPETPIILCTGYSALISEQKAKGLGIKEFLMKPVYITSLAKTVRKVLDNKIS